MVIQLTTKNCRIYDKSRININRHLAKLAQELPTINDDLIVVRLNIKKNTEKYYPPKTPTYKNKTYADEKSNLAYFEGSIAFRLPRKRLYASFKGRTIEECVDVGFTRIFKEVKKYKSLHYSSVSKYPDRSSIREGLR